MIFWVSRDNDGMIAAWSKKPKWVAGEYGGFWTNSEDGQSIGDDATYLWFELFRKIEVGEAAKVRLTCEVLRKEKGDD